MFSMLSKTRMQETPQRSRDVSLSFSQKVSMVSEQVSFDRIPVSLSSRLVLLGSVLLSLVDCLLVLRADETPFFLDSLSESVTSFFLHFV